MVLYFSNNSIVAATIALRLFAEYMKYFPVSPVPAYMPGIESVQADDLSRVYKLFPNANPLFIMFHILSYCTRFIINITRCQITTLSPGPREILVYSDYSTVFPRKRKNLGRIPVSSNSFGSVNNTHDLLEFISCKKEYRTFCR